MVESEAKVNTDVAAGTIDVTPAEATAAVDFTDNTGTASLTNTLPETELELKAKKDFNGNLTAGQFTFELYETDSAFGIDGRTAIQTKTNAADGSVIFDEITYTRPGTYYYVVKEIKGDDATIVYDEKKVNVTVTVTRRGGQGAAAVAGLQLIPAE